MRLRTTFHLVTAFTAIGLAGPALAQEGTPAATAPSASCDDVQPRDVAFFSGLAATPAAEQDRAVSQATPASETAADMTLEGETADEQTTNEVAMVYTQLVDCLNQGDYLRAYALYTDDYLQRNLSEELISSLHATPVPVEESTQSEFRGVLDARLMEDDQIGALVLVSNPQSGDTVIRSILIRDGDHLRILDEMPVETTGPDQGSGSAQGTPSA